MRTPTTEQRAVLNKSARVRIVRAVPGSGKTWLVAELIRQELDKWPTKTSGIVALSFTRVGGDEIRKAVGYELDHPHFVGTIDAFLFRYVVRPFLQICYPYLAAPRLIPGEWGAEHWGNCSRGQKTTVGNGIKLFSCVFIDEENDKAVVAHKPYPTQSLRRLDNSELPQVRDGKMRLWKSSGFLTHSDAALWASKILSHKELGAAIRAELIRRFPLMIVDELQDTGYFLGKSILLLLHEPAARGVLIGDPDQAIYEFNGARPDLFKRFESIEDAVTLPLSNSQRCAFSVASVASHLKESGGKVGPASTKSGQAFLIRYKEMIADTRRIVKAVATERKGSSVKVIARHTVTVEALNGHSANTAPKLGCPPLNHMQRGVAAFRQGRQVAAVAAVRSALETAVFEYEGVDDADLKKHNIQPSRWKQLAVECLLRANAIATTGTLYDWQTEVGKVLDEKLSKFDLDPSLQFSTGKLIPRKLKGHRDACADYLHLPAASETISSDIPIKTVHGVKGETHDVTIFVCPDPKRVDHCPSSVWWSDDEKDREEQRIAYVAMTRTQGDLIVCVSEHCYQRLFASHKPFVDSFECMTVDEFISTLNQDGKAQ